MKNMTKTAVVGVGNPLRKDDGIGIYLLNKLSKKEKIPRNIELIDGGTGGMSLLHIFPDYDDVLIIDAVDFNEEIGEVKIFTLEDVCSDKSPVKVSTHESDVLKIINLMQNLEEDTPEKIYVFGVQPKDTSYGEVLSSELQKKIDPIFKKLENTVYDLCCRSL